MYVLLNSFLNIFNVLIDTVYLVSVSQKYISISTYVFRLGFTSLWASLVTQLVKNPPAVQETWVWSLGWEDPLEKEEATHSSILA